ncbi:hypothetical protein QZH41_005014 [Actinostola sp. cb2023]|nr:hypothetical protein QZH41_005014 [Actinostola sp. cb2023]
MSDFFGKRGRSWHVSAVTTKKEEKYEVECFVHMFNTCNQNSFAVASILEHLFYTIKQEYPTIRKAFLRSDNAGCYHNSFLLLALSDIGEKTGIKPLRYDFSDPQAGKDICDRKTAPMKAHMKRWKEICEEFLEFKKLERTSGVAISTALLDTLRDLNIPIEDCRGQGYDGAASMSSGRVGVQAEIRNHGAPKAIYIHCAGHCLNLVVVHACALTAVKNMIDKVKQVCIYFNYSPKRNGLLAAIIEDQHPENTRKKPLLTLCTTRWAERAESYDHFYEAFKCIVFTLEIIAHNLHYDECPDQYKDGWSPSSRKDASGLLQAITTYDFIITFVCAHITLSHMTGLTVKLQKKTNDIFKEFTMVSDIQNTYQDLRNDIDGHFGEVYDVAVDMAASITVAPQIPRVAVWQQHRANAPAASPKDYYRINLGVPFLDHIISQLDERFSSITVKATQLLGLVPSVIQQMQVTEQELRDVLELYQDDLPSPQLFPAEFRRWKVRSQSICYDRDYIAGTAIRHNGHSIERDLNNPPHKRGIKIAGNPEFSSSNRLLDAKIKQLKKEGKENTQHKPAIAAEDLRKLKESDVLKPSTPLGLLRNVWFHTTLFWCRRGREGQSLLTPNIFQFENDPQGKAYITMAHNECTKNHPGGINDVESFEKDGRMYETTSEANDGYYALRLYISKLNPSCKSFFQYPKREWKPTDED